MAPSQRFVFLDSILVLAVEVVVFEYFSCHPNYIKLEVNNPQVTIGHYFLHCIPFLTFVQNLSKIEYFWSLQNIIAADALLSPYVIIIIMTSCIAPLTTKVLMALALIKKFPSGVLQQCKDQEKLRKNQYLCRDTKNKFETGWVFRVVESV